MTDSTTTPGSAPCAAIGDLLSGYVDQELTQQQAQRVRVHLDTCEACRRLHADLRNMKEQLRQLSWPISDEEMLDKLEKDLFASGARNLGWILLAVVALFAVAAGTVTFFLFLAAPDVSPLVKLFNVLLIVGGFALFVSVVRERLLTYKKDKYRNVKL
ncbi:MAG: zf-HC2 domain-containing protein [Pseudomonadota bacterium]|nr:zf-HC2 domain-containing protein [Pseudomonadota bacterium]